MIRPSLLLSLLTAMLTSDHTPASNVSAPSQQAVQSVQMVDETLTEEQQIVEDARRSVGHELCDL